jgi:hypothetical protein
MGVPEARTRGDAGCIARNDGWSGHFEIFVMATMCNHKQLVDRNNFLNEIKSPVIGSAVHSGRYQKNHIMHGQGRRKLGRGSPRLSQATRDLTSDFVQICRFQQPVRGQNNSPYEIQSKSICIMFKRSIRSRW